MTKMFGTKEGAGVWQNIVAAFPPHDTFIELFAGTGAIARHMQFGKGSGTLFRNLILIEKDKKRATALHKEFPTAATYNLDAFRYIAGTIERDMIGRTLIYADPPYLHATRGKARYEYELSDKAHAHLLEALKFLGMKAMVAISGYPSALYDQHLDGWRTIAFQTMTRGGVRTEMLWMNYPADAVHWHTQAGKNFRERERIKRKAGRWAANFGRLEAGERQAILAELLKV